MRRASTAIDFVEDMAHKQIRYENIFGEQAEVLRSDPLKFEAAMAQLQKSPLVAKHGQRGEPTTDNVIAGCGSGGAGGTEWLRVGDGLRG